MDRPEAGCFNRITTTTGLGHQEEKQKEAETERKKMAHKVISSVVSLLLNEVPGYLSVRRTRLMAVSSQPSTQRAPTVPSTMLHRNCSDVRHTCIRDQNW
jgi:hypothetical protein